MIKQVQMDNHMILSQEAIWYYQLGSKMICKLQVLSRMRSGDNGVQMILHDGIVYAGFKCDYSTLQKMAKNEKKIQNMDTVGLRQVQTSGSVPIIPELLDVVQVQAQKEADNELLKILKLTIVKTGLKSILCQSSPITLQEYMNIKHASPDGLDRERDVGELGKPTKRVKQNEERVEEVVEPNLITLPPQQTNIQNTSIKINEERIKLENERIAENQKIQQTEDRILIKDLYERIPNFKLICRVNYLERFRYKNMNEGISMMLVDELGDEIKGVLNPRQTDRSIIDLEVPENEIPKLEVGKTYVFENGQVELVNGILKLKLVWEGIRESKAVVQSLNPKKMYRVGEILQLINTQTTKSVNGRRGMQLNACGIFTGFKKQPYMRNDKNNYVVVGGLCDPIKQKQINFSLFVNNPSCFPQAGTVLTLHNMELVQQEAHYLYSTTVRSSQSYFLVQTDNQHQYLSDLVEISRNKQWKSKYSNLSDKYVKRTFAETKKAIGALMVGAKMFFEIECKVSNINFLKEYKACSICGTSVQADNSIAYCGLCRKKEPWTTQTLFKGEATKGEEIIEICFNSKILEQFVGISFQNYSSLAQAERTAVLSKINRRSMVLRGKSERTGLGCRTYVNQALLLQL